MFEYFLPLLLRHLKGTISVKSLDNAVELVE